MKKIQSVFCRDYDGDRLARDEVVPGSEWVLAGEGVASRKWDGTACLVRNGLLFKRRDMKAKILARGKKPPVGWEPYEPAPDGVTGHWPGWFPVGDGPEDKWYREVWARGVDHAGSEFVNETTYELCGQKINKNPERLNGHHLIKHGSVEIPRLSGVPLTFETIRVFVSEALIEGVVWLHPDGRMAKIKRKDFGFPWPV